MQPDTCLGFTELGARNLRLVQFSIGAIDRLALRAGIGPIASGVGPNRGAKEAWKGHGTRVVGEN